MSKSLILDKLMETTTSENTLELLKKQQEQIQRQLQQQELINNNLYQSLINSGILKRITTSTTANIFDSLQQNHFTLNEYEAPTTLANLLNNYKNPLTSLLPFSDMFNGMSSVFERLFGSKLMIYAIIGMFFLLVFGCFVCFLGYCCCCTRIGRYLTCCFQCNLLPKKGNSKKKEAEAKRCCI